MLDSHWDNADGISAASQLGHEPLKSVLRENTHHLEIGSSLDSRLDHRAKIFLDDGIRKCFDYLISLGIGLPLIVSKLLVQLLQVVLLVENGLIFGASLSQKGAFRLSPDGSLETLPHSVASLVQDCIQLGWIISVLVADDVLRLIGWLHVLHWIEDSVGGVLGHKSPFLLGEDA